MVVDSVIIHDIRSTHNVGAILRTCDGFGVNKVYIGGFSPYPRIKDDTRLPHIIDKLTGDIHKTALGAEKTIKIIIYDDILALLSSLRADGNVAVALEQSSTAVSLRDFRSDRPIAIVIGREVEGIDQEIQNMCDSILEIPMRGHKESFNVSVATGIALYALCQEY